MYAPKERIKWEKEGQSPGQITLAALSRETVLLGYYSICTQNTKELPNELQF